MAAPKPTPRFISKERGKITALPLYCDGFVRKKHTGEKDFNRYFAELRGSTIFLYSDEKNATYTEKLELQNLKSLDTWSLKENYISAEFTLTLLNEEVRLKIENPDAGEEWKGFILTVAKLEIPSKLQLLPGQLLRLKEVLKDEKQRQARQPVPVKEQEPPEASNVPQCFYSVSRNKAIEMLAESPEFGNMILRPGSEKMSFAVTVRQLLTDGPSIKHYKVMCAENGFSIALDTPVTVSSLCDVTDHFVKETNGNLRPFIQPHTYATTIDQPVVLNERKDQQKRQIPQAVVAPMIQNPTPPPTSSQSSDHEYLEVNYINVDEHDKKNQLNLKDDRPLIQAVPVPDSGISDELLKALQKRRATLGDY
ncbi:signal-transducing adaptor protein 1-like [Acipenser ruthenus]|uniref:signal-transducing adaptor protein 1-like n=1 Tax=Acipenser ruthenus TaxID=7906 RepID=UPI00155FD08C|nr:signal-transducing adaptor protein 1-like [Acipenser ruthenus]